jgi:hypothetical protein
MIANRDRDEKPRGERLKRLDAVRRLYFQKIPIYEIAERLKVTVRQAKKDLALIRRMELSVVKRESQKHLVQLLAGCDQVETEAWQQWQRSKEDMIVTTTTRREVFKPSTGEVVELRDSSRQRKPQSGDPRYLQVINQVLERRARLLRLEEPEATSGNLAATIEVVVESRDEVQRMMSFKEFAEAREHAMQRKID